MAWAVRFDVVDMGNSVVRVEELESLDLASPPSEGEPVPLCGAIEDVIMMTEGVLGIPPPSQALQAVARAVDDDGRFRVTVFESPCGGDQE